MPVKAEIFEISGRYGVTSVVAYPAKAEAILDTWHTVGMRGTGSHDAVAKDVVIPERRMAVAGRIQRVWR